MVSPRLDPTTKKSDLGKSFMFFIGLLEILLLPLRDFLGVSSVAYCTDIDREQFRTESVRGGEKLLLFNFINSIMKKNFYTTPSVRFCNVRIESGFAVSVESPSINDWVRDEDDSIEF